MEEKILSHRAIKLKGLQTCVFIPSPYINGGLRYSLENKSYIPLYYLLKLIFEKELMFLFEWKNIVR